MSDFWKKCDRCGRKSFRIYETSGCRHCGGKDQYDAWEGDNILESDAFTVFGSDAADAAVYFAERLCESDYECYPMFEKGCDVFVRKLGDEEVTKCEVNMEYEPSFRAAEAKEEEAK